MATKALNFRMDEKEMVDLKKVAAVFNISVTDLVKNAISECRKIKKGSVLQADSQCGKCFRGRNRRGS